MILFFHPKLIKIFAFVKEVIMLECRDTRVGNVSVFIVAHVNFVNYQLLLTNDGAENVTDITFLFQLWTFDCLLQCYNTLRRAPIVLNVLFIWLLYWISEWIQMCLKFWMLILMDDWKWCGNVFWIYFLFIWSHLYFYGNWVVFPHK